MSIAYVMPKNAKELEAIHANAIQSVNTARVNVQIAAVATIRHAYVHGDWTYAQKLVDGLGNTVNGAALVEWFVVYGGLVNDENGFTGWSGKDHIKENFEKAKATMWWSLKVKNPFKGFDLEAALKKVVADHAKIQASMATRSDEDKAKINMQVNADTIQAVLKLVNFEQLMEEEKAA